MGACYRARCLLWNFMCCLEGSPTSISLASRSAPVPLSPLAPYPCKARVRSERRARHENGARSDRGTGTEREWEALTRWAWRRPRGATQEGASTGGREHRRRKLRGVRVSELPKEPANNPQSLRVKPPKSRKFLSFAGPFAGHCNSFYDKCVDQPQTTSKLPANLNSGLPNAVLLASNSFFEYPLREADYCLGIMLS
jgi:hypothetical protein